jgi:macrolide transport system ATP-binding/permease protein
MHLAQDARFALRQLRKSPGFTVTAIFMLALGLCASVSIFAFVDAAMLKPLPYREPARLVSVFGRTLTFPFSNLSYPDYVDFKKLTQAFSAFEGYRKTATTMTTASGAESLDRVRVSDGFFRALGITPILGRDFAPGDDLPSGPHVAMLTYATWQKLFASNPAIVGQTLTLDGNATTIIGVLPREFHFPPVEPVEIFTAMHAASECDLRRSCHAMYGFARLKDGVGYAAAVADVESVAARLEQQYPDSNRDQGAALKPLDEAISGNIRPILLVLLAGAVLLLLIASVNIASLLLVRSESRRREIAIRNALGASTARLVSQFVTEGVLLVIAGTAFGLLGAYWAMHGLTRLIPALMFQSMTYLHDLGFNVRILGFAGGVAAIAAVLFSLTPMVRLRASNMREGLAEGSRGSAGHAWRRIGSKLVIVELATAIVLLVGAGLLGKSLYQLLRVDIGFRPDHLAVMAMSGSAQTYDTPARRNALQRQILARVAALPGVESVGLASQPPVTGNGNTSWFRIIGKPWHGEHNDTPHRGVSVDHFKTIGATLLRGRYFTEADDLTKPRVIIVNESMARQYFPGEDALGKQITPIGGNVVPQEIVGIIANIKEGPLDVPTPPVIYVPFAQDPDRSFFVIARTAQDPGMMLPTMSTAIRQLDPNIVTGAASTMSTRINDSMSAYQHRSSAWLVGGFACVALLLSVIGLYGVIAYSVSQRNREIGVRMALGAHPGAVYRLVLKEASWLAGGGILLGLICAAGAAKAMRGLLFGVESWDVPTLAGVAVLLGIAAMAASYIPARRAASVNPVEALRAE